MRNITLIKVIWVICVKINVFEHIYFAKIFSVSKKLLI